MESPELLLPAGNLSKLKVGLQYGGDAFYLGMPSFSMRSRTNNFTETSLMEGVELIRKAGKTLYITMNIYPRGNKIDAFKKHIDFIKNEVKPDAMIVADPGVFELIKELWPEAVIHMSVQANILNYRAVKFWQERGAKRVILPRELMLSEIREIHEMVPDMELEFFVHGAICMAYSGRCLLSNYMTGRDSNQGICAHSCRWEYQVIDEDAMEKRKQELAARDAEYARAMESDEKEYYLEEAKRPGEFYPIDEDEHGTYIMNSKDMCLLPYLKELTEAGICSFKVEGRNKTEHYLATTARAYRKATDDMMAGKEFDRSLLDDVMKSANRGYIPGFIWGFPGAGDDVFYDSNAPQETHKFVGIVSDRKHAGMNDVYEVEIKNRLELGQKVEVMTPEKQFEVKVDRMFDLDGSEVGVVHGGAGPRFLKLSEDLPENSMLRIKV